MLLFLLALVAAPAWAGWDKLVEADGWTLYVDTASLRMNGNFRRIWQMEDLKQRAKDGEMSRRTLMEYDCKDERARSISTASFSGPMLNGQTLRWSDDPSKWMAIPPGTFADIFLKATCAI